jgi:chromosome segregation ATPase
MKHLPWTTSVVMALALTSVSCDKIKPPAPEMQKPPTASSQTGQPQEERTAFALAAQKELDELRTAIAELKAKAAAANQQARAGLEADVEKLEAGWRDAQQRLGELKSATAGTWSQLKEAFGKSREQLKAAIANVRKTPM